MTLTWLQLAIYGLACFRLSVLLSEDDGPGHLMLKLRSLLKREAKEHKAVRKTYVHEGIECLRCTSLQLAIPIAAFACLRSHLWLWLARTGDVFLLAMALSGIAVLLNRIPKQ